LKKVRVGLVSDHENSGHLKKANGRTTPVLLNTNADADSLLSMSIEKHARHFKQFNKFLDHAVRYSDMPLVQYLPGSCIPFTPEKYKDDLLKPYSKLYFWLCEKNYFENANYGSESDDTDLATPSISLGCTSSASALSLATNTITPTYSSAAGSTSSTFSCSSTATVSLPSITFPAKTMLEMWTQRNLQAFINALLALLISL
jgi:hypothetical protein